MSADNTAQDFASEQDAMAAEWAAALEEQTHTGSAVGEVVVVNDKFGIRLTDIVTPSERMRRLSRSH